MKSKSIDIKPGVVAWVHWVKQWGELPKGLVDTMKVTVVALNKKERTVVVRRADGMLFSINPHLLDAGKLHQFEGEKGWRGDNDTDVLAVYEASLYAMRAQKADPGLAWSVAQSIGLLEWTILRNGGAFYADDEANNRIEGEFPVWVVR